MLSKIVEILVILMDEIRHRGFAEKRMEILSGELLDQGYSEQEISTAFTWIYDRFGSTHEMTDPSPSSFRVLHGIEKIFISPQAQGYLLQLQALGILTQSEFERVVERIMLIASPGLELELVRQIVLETLFDNSQNSEMGFLDLTLDDLIQ
ncbi:DUF494 family protein [bacterium]|nr:DUF494 family protein [FCB group bacterium]MBL7192183.1 DUF494 family protein [bacterium]